MKRYDIDVQPDRSYYGQGERFEAFAYESEQGDWVRQEDVEDLLALNAEMLEALEAIEMALAMGYRPAEVLQEGGAIRNAVKSVITKSKGEDL